MKFLQTNYHTMKTFVYLEDENEETSYSCEQAAKNHKIFPSLILNNDTSVWSETDNESSLEQFLGNFEITVSVDDQ